MNFRSMTNSGETSRPLPASPLVSELTNRFPSTPATGFCFPNEPDAGPAPNASPETVQAPKPSPSKSATTRSASTAWTTPAAANARRNRIET